MYGQKRESAKQINFLASAKFQSFTFQAEKTYQAGDVFPANDATAVGIVINDVKVNGEPQPVGVIVEGWLLADRLPDVTEAAKTAMKDIKWRPFLTSDDEGTETP